MRTLLIDTAHRAGYLALGEGKRLIAQVFLNSMARHSESAAQLLAKLLDEEQIAPASLDQIAVGVGPGSYTGVRVGVALSLGLRLATGVPLLPYCSLRAYRGGMAAFDARAGGIYLLSDGEPRVLSLADVAELGGLIVSPDAEEIQRRLAGRGPQVKSAEPDLEGLLCELMQESARQTMGQIEPIYLRKGRVELANIDKER
jgi:tRNA threonylcarbamoyl adenosine modification protein YeaZ